MEQQEIIDEFNVSVTFANEVYDCHVVGLADAEIYFQVSYQKAGTKTIIPNLRPLDIDEAGNILWQDGDHVHDPEFVSLIGKEIVRYNSIT
jgi:hypothetical protein